jgi:SWI/SNF-related matrix-associated actin-dependent regulator of chromatin subfamily A member 5
MSLLAQLRKAANHPFLFPGIEKVSVDGLPSEDIVSVSGKMQVLDLLLRSLYEKGHRVVLFSQYTRTLDIISDYLDMRGYRHSRLDGSTNRVMREVKINLFNKPKSPIFIFCLSTRAGGEGLNLFTADTVILFDSDWNPQSDNQAMGRVHRIGQTRVVHVYRLVTAGSVEECIVQRAQRKLFLDTMINRGR